MSGRKVELDEVIVPTLNLESSSSEKFVHVMPTPTGEELMIKIMKLQIKLLQNLIGQPEHDPHQSGMVILFWKSCYLTMTNL